MRFHGVGEDRFRGFPPIGAELLMRAAAENEEEKRRFGRGVKSRQETRRTCKSFVSATGKVHFVVYRKFRYLCGRGLSRNQAMEEYRLQRVSEIWIGGKSANHVFDAFSEPKDISVVSVPSWWKNLSTPLPSIYVKSIHMFTCSS